MWNHFLLKQPLVHVDDTITAKSGQNKGHEEGCHFEGGSHNPKIVIFHHKS